MSRLIKRYGSRKLYDTTESRYVSLEEIAIWIRDGEKIQVVDNASSEDVTTQTLTQIISEEGRRKSQFLSNELLHDLIRAGGSVVSNRVKQIQEGVEGFVKKSLDRIVPVSKVRDEMVQLRARLDELETALISAENIPSEPEPEQAKSNGAPSEEEKKTTRRRTTKARKTTAKPAAKSTTTRRKTTAKTKAAAEKKEEVAK
jgi:polyhydroxyalkanoate synthesis repressor PhaR